MFVSDMNYLLQNQIE